MFTAIARRYDLNNRLHSLGRDQAWRRLTVRMAAVEPGEDVVDVACGTGDLSEAFARAGAGSVIGVDFTPAMLDIARDKLTRRSWTTTPDYRDGDAMDLDLPDASADIVSIAFGIRNVAVPVRAIAEFHRILRPGGRLIILEFCEPRLRLMRLFNGFYCKRIMPLTASAISGDRSGAYKYLPRSVETFSEPDHLAEMMRETGFEVLRQRRLSLGICAITLGRKTA